MEHVIPYLSQKDRCVVCLVCKEWRNKAQSSLFWKVLDLRGMSMASSRLSNALSQERFNGLKEVNLEFCQGLDDAGLVALEGKDLISVNLNACQKISDAGVKFLACSFPNLETVQLYWNLRIGDESISLLASKCLKLRHLSLSGCKNVTDASLTSISTFLTQLTYLDLTRCPKLTDDGLLKVLSSCSRLTCLLLYADSSFTDKSLFHISKLPHLERLDLCGMQHLSDHGLEGIAECRSMRSLNLTWCVQITDRSICKLAQNCQCLESLSLYGIRGVTDLSLDLLAANCSATLSALDVNGCINMKMKSKEDLLVKFPNLEKFLLHS